MLLFLIAYLGGVLTILSPCILPVLPFVFARSDQPFVKSGLPLLIGMALTFALVATLAAVGGGWAVQANQFGRIAALALLALFGLSLVFPELADRVTRPLVALGSRLSESASDKARSGGSSFWPSLLLGVATGLLWAPCAGPILGLVLTGAALQGASAQTSLLLLCYALGAATSLAVALLIGGRVFGAMKRSLGASEWIRRGLGVALLCGVVAIALGADTGVLARLSLAGTSGVEQRLIERVAPGMAAAPAPQTVASGPLPVEGPMPSLAGAVTWLNSPPLSAEQLRGKVVLVDFWTYSCINCLRSIPYVRAWAEKYRSQGLVVIGVHAPEFAFEKKLDNVQAAVKDLKIDYPVAVDNDYAIWRAFGNRYWPAHYFIDAQGRVRHHHFGEGEYAQSEQVIRQLLAQAGRTVDSKSLVAVQAQGAEVAADLDQMKSPETYVGYERARSFAPQRGLVPDKAWHYQVPAELALNQWSLRGDWTIAKEVGRLDKPGGAIVYRFHARDLHLVLGAGDTGKPIRFRVRLDGQAPGADHGADIDDAGLGMVTGQKLYQLIRQRPGQPGQPIRDRTFEIEFLDPGAEAFAFTFG